ncbi:MAG: alpha/beta hydrolase [Phycisphaerae bacterium]|nr:alpha/beta hydrolase [Phycisphaerae bacterium]
MIHLRSLCVVLLISPMVQALNVTQSPDLYKLRENILYRDSTEAPLTDDIKKMCRLDLYYPADTPGFPTVVWFHGGGLTGGKRDIPEALKNQQMAVATVDYRLNPGVTCPAYIEDAAAAVAWVFKHIQTYGGDPNLVFVSGHSAGGYLTSMVGLDKRWLARHDVDADRIAGLIPFSGHTITHFTIRQERDIPGTQPIVDEFAPLYHVRADAPPLVLITGDRELEMLGRYEENAYMYRMMKVAGHDKTELYEVQGFNHGNMPQGAFPLLIDHVKAWTRAHTAVTVQLQNRYLEPVFSDVDCQEDILFRTTRDHTGHLVELTLDVYRPRGDTFDNRPAILWIHGGGFRPGNDKRQKYIVHMATAFARRGYVCAAPDYRTRQSPRDDMRGTLKDAVEDGLASLAWMRDNHRVLGVDADRIALGGGSAGGMIAVSMAALENSLAATSHRPGLFALIDLWGSPAPENRLMTIHPQFPPTVIVHGTADQTVPYAWSQTLAAELTAAGVDHLLYPIVNAKHTPAKDLPEMVEVCSHFLYRAMEK